MNLNSRIVNDSALITNTSSVKLGDGTNRSLDDLLQKFSPCVLNTTIGKTIAHRGLYSSVPENTIASFEQACLNGFWGIETDIYNTSDGELVCIHDKTVDRTTDGTGTVNDMTFKEIQACTIDTGNGISDYPGLKIPKFEDYIAICKQYGAIPVIEIKGIKNNDIKYYKKMLSIIREYGMEDNCMCIGSLECMTIVRSLTRRIHVQVIVYQGDDPTDDLLLQIAALENSGADFHNTHISSNMIKKCHELGLLVNCWTINDSYIIENFRNLGVDFITSNTYSLSCNPYVSQTKYDKSLKTSNKNIVGAINEVNNATNAIEKKIGNLSFKALTQSEYNALATKDPNTIYLITG